MVSLAKPQPRYARRGLVYDLSSLLVLLAFGLCILVPLALPLILWGRQAAKQTTCAANLAGLGKGLYVYASDGDQGMPIADHLAAERPEKGKVRYAPGMIGKHRGKEGDPAAGETDNQATEISTTRNLWILVRMGGATPASFICPSSQDVRNDEDNPFEFWDFRSYREVSYGYQVPYGKLGRPSMEGDQRCLLAADKGPYGAALEAGAENPGVPKLLPSDGATKWRPWNSPNHQRGNQNCLYVDTHVDTSEKPTAGPNFDNLYTRWSDASGGTKDDPLVRSQGTPPTGMETPWGSTDALIYP